MTITTSSYSASKGRLLSAAFLISGTCVGGGMLALPVETSQMGFFPSLLAMALTWVFMMISGLLLVEANLWMPKGAHIMTMASHLLGKMGKWLCVTLYLFMAYASLIAYNSGGAVILIRCIKIFFSTSMTYGSGCVLFGLLFGVLIYLGTKKISRINVLLMAGMILSYVGLVGFGFKEVSIHRLIQQQWSSLGMAFPLLLATFSYQMIIPTLTPYLHRDPKSLRFAILLGTTIPFCAYAIWQWIVLGSVPLVGSGGLQEAFAKGQSATEALYAIVSNSYFITLAESFAFFALVTSYLGIALGLFDFLKDGLKLQQWISHKLSIGALIVLPVIFFAAAFPNAFVLALEVSGGFGDALLSGIIPALMVWMGRYRKSLTSIYQVTGGKGLLVAIFFCSSYVLVIQWIKLIK
ncbi:Tyrosine-specific transport protein [Candidatus Rhabdochlamydia oedothoracis]|uniref:Tyrosine-specific transport protein n=1 Tax=Candidatus Rhabdochlamydia oedothoracis TaxID=2720720 RepID=A0ABX8V070_9BACT|nr:MULTISPECIES: aromatic amino acid transport family protein [Rhabdochlamydia]KAG6559714.1 Tyrosine-specific transport protein [Candidatus Rhabdochlamydia sp. W815]MCL6756623.1 amino acid transporter [Candidatus Rhabdochlamydia oedothoracis]QYF48613.1 Tyrosine-specific transport protein [Candidatus Rhabdochlamydia oedothoracis]